MAFKDDIINNLIKIGEIVSQPIIDKWFYWAMLTFILHHKDWKLANFNIAISMWLVHSLSTIYPKIMSYGFKNLDATNAWKFQDVPPFIFLFLSEIIGDWYVFFVIKRIANRKKSLIAGILCLMSNCVKLYISYFLFTERDDCEYREKIGPLKGFDCFTDSQFWRKYQKLEVTNIIAVGLYYGICFILLFTSKNQNQFSSSFSIIKLFRHESKYRMMFSCLCAVISFLFGIPFIMDTYKHNFEFRLEVTREAIMSITYYMIYIDQILNTENNTSQVRSTGSTPNYVEDNNYKKRSNPNLNDIGSESSFDEKKSFRANGAFNNY